jgi:hypothetical protein
MSRVSVAEARRALQVALGVVWLLAATLQFQPFMFERGFALEILKPAAVGNPAFVARPASWAAGVVLAQPQLWNTLFALAQLSLALGLFWRRSVKVALAGTVIWSVIVWWLGEGMGGVLAGTASPLTGAPGAVILYALLAVLIWPRAERPGCSAAESSVLGHIAPVAWLLVWGSEAYFALLPANDSPAVLRGLFLEMADGEPRPIAALDRFLSRVVEHSAVGVGFGVLFAVCALAPLLTPRFAKPFYGLGMVVALLTWVGQDFGEIFTGHGTDPNSGPLLVLLALSYWPVGPKPERRGSGVERQPERLPAALAAASLASTPADLPLTVSSEESVACASAQECRLSEALNPS